MDFVYDMDGPDLLYVLRDNGRREHRRLFPPADRPLRVALLGVTGWRLGWRAVDDISLAGMGLKLAGRDAKVVRVGEGIEVQLQVPSGLVQLRGHTAHLSRTRKGWHSEWHLGVLLHTRRAPPWIRQQFIDYLLTLATLG